MGGDGYFATAYKARCSMWGDVIINCRQDDDGCISCTSLAGDIVGLFPVPPGEQPFDAWVADKLVGSRNQSPEQLRLVDPHGSIFCTRKLGAEFVCMKHMSIDLEHEGMPTTQLRAISIQKDLIHNNVVRLLDVVLSPKTIVTVFEFMEETLRAYLRRRLHLSPGEVKYFMAQLMTGMDFLHARRIIHRNLWPKNLFIDSDGTLKIGGFSMARAAILPVRPYTHEVITLWYRPPEILLGCKVYSLPVDMWSC